MAELRKVILGSPSGKFGDVIFRIMNGKKFFSRRAKKYKRTKSIKLKTTRFNFGTTVYFAKVTNSIPELKAVWKESKVKATNSYHKIIKANSGLVKTGTLSAFNKITPEGLELNLTSASIINNNLNVIISFPSVRTGLPATMCLVFYFERDKIYAQTEVIEETTKDDVYYLSISLDSEIRKELKKNNSPTVYFAVAGVPERKKVFWTSTVQKEF